MNRRSASVPAALAAVTALLLTACGSGGDADSSSDKIKGAEQTSAEPTADASESAAAAGRPEIKLPESFEMRFESWTDNDPKLQAVLDDGREALRAEHAAIIDADPDSEAVAFYNSGAALEASRQWIKGYVDADESLVGEARVFDPQVRINSSGLGVLLFCMDESKGATKNRRTGKVSGTPADVSPTLQYRNTLEKNSKGVWKTRSSETERGACGQ
ncbi:hypothetical protein ABZ853_29385 [Streptomyces albidoflavus]